MGKFIDRTGHVFGRLTVLKRASNIGTKTAWDCICKCGQLTTVQASHLHSGSIKSCGCFHNEVSAINGKKKVTHGLSSHYLYRTWVCMKSRCYNTKSEKYKHWGGRGITVCSRWLNSFENFIADMGERPNGRTLDRINNDGNYERGNCRWATAYEQRINQRRCKQ